MKLTEILKKAEEAEKKIIVIKKPTKTVYGIAIRLKGDPELEIIEFDWVPTHFGAGDNDFEIKDKHKLRGCKKQGSVLLDVNLCNKLIDSIQKLLEMEI